MVDVSLYPWSSQLCSTSSVSMRDKQLNPHWQGVGCIMQTLVVKHLRSAFYKYSLKVLHNMNV